MPHRVLLQRQIVIFRRGDDWRPRPTIVDLGAASHGKEACPASQIGMIHERLP